MLTFEVLLNCGTNITGLFVSSRYSNLLLMADFSFLGVMIRLKKRYRVAENEGSVAVCVTGVRMKNKNFTVVMTTFSDGKLLPI